jgi:dTDP-4-amino-4,6-dideoxygalactose transaminase
MHFRFPLLLEGGVDHCQEAFRRCGIHVRRGVDKLLHRLVGTPDNEFPIAVAHYSTTVSLPIYPALQPIQVEACVQAISAIL